MYYNILLIMMNFACTEDSDTQVTSMGESPMCLLASVKN